MELVQGEVFLRVFYELIIVGDRSYENRNLHESRSGTGVKYTLFSLSGSLESLSGHPPGRVWTQQSPTAAHDEEWQCVGDSNGVQVSLCLRKEGRIDKDQASDLWQSELSRDLGSSRSVKIVLCPFIVRHAHNPKTICTLQENSVEKGLNLSDSPRGQ